MIALRVPRCLGIALSALLAALLLPACATSSGAATAAAPAATAHRYGVLVMAHGGGERWNGAVDAAMAPLRGEFPVQLAFGMADAASLQRGVDALQAQGVDRIGVVRLFISGDSFYRETRQIFGLDPGAPPKPAAGPMDMGAHAGHDMMDMAFWRIDSNARFALSKDGLADAPQMGAVLADRARALSKDPAHEDVLILAHGPGDDAENERWLHKIDARAEAVRQALPFRRVQVMTLREDWPEKRAPAEAQVRDFVRRAVREHGRAIVIPYRVEGFGPYADVLKGLDYVADGRGLLPSPQVADWVRSEAEALRDGGFDATGD